MEIPNSHSLMSIDTAIVLPREHAWRSYPAEQIEEAKRQLLLTGIVVEPPLLDDNNRVVCGGAIVLAAKELGWAKIPVLKIASMSAEQLRLYAISARAMSDMGKTDSLVLLEEIRDLERLLGAEVLANLAIADGEMTRILRLAEASENENLDQPPQVDTAPVVTRPDDLWLVGRHRLLCGTSLVRENVELLMNGELAQFALVDPPYNLSARTISSKPGREEFAFAHGEMSPNEFTRFLTQSMRLGLEFSEPGSLHAWFMSYHYLPELFRAGLIVFGRPKAMCTWVKSQPGQGSLFRSRTEQIVYFKNGDARHRNNIQLGKYERNRSTAWHYDGMTTASAERDETLQFHASPKPVALLKDAILDVTSHGGIVLDLFGGICSVMVAAHAAERRAYVIEIEPRYVDVGLRRMRDHYGIDAIRATDGMRFSELERAVALDSGCSDDG